MNEGLQVFHQLAQGLFWHQITTGHRASNEAVASKNSKKTYIFY